MRVTAPPIIPGDVNHDCNIDNLDINPFISVLTGVDQNPENQLRSDMNGDGTADGSDVQSFVNILLSP